MSEKAGSRRMSRPEVDRIRAGERLVRAEWDRLCGCFEPLTSARIRINPRLRSVLGRTLRRSDQEPDMMVEIARWLLEEGDAGHILDTVRHESAHVLAGHEDPDAGHGPIWKRWARRLGARPERSCRDRDLAARSPTARLGPKWALRCWGCQRHVAFRFRLDWDWVGRVRTTCCGAPVDPVPLR